MNWKFFQRIRIADQHLYIGFLKYHSSQLSAISAISRQPIVYPKVIAFTTTTASNRIWIINSILNSKLGHRKEYFFLFIGFGLQVPEIPSHFSICLKKFLGDFSGLITTATGNRVPWKLYYTKLIEQLVTQQLNLWANI